MHDEASEPCVVSAYARNTVALEGDKVGSAFFYSPAGSAVLVHAWLEDLCIVGGAHVSAVGRPKTWNVVWQPRREIDRLNEAREETTAAHHSRDRHQQSPMMPT